MPETPKRRRSSREDGRRAGTPGRLRGRPEHVKEQVGRFVRRVRAVPRGQRQGELVRLLGDLLVDLLEPAVEQRDDVGFLRALAAPLPDRLGDARDDHGGWIRRAVVGRDRLRPRRQLGRSTRSRPCGTTGPWASTDVEHDVAVAVDAHLPHGERVAGLLALAPELGARAAPEVRLASSRASFRAPLGWPRRACAPVPSPPPARSRARGRARRR